jgi:hypothetical protein
MIEVLDLAYQFVLLLFGERLMCSIHVFLSWFDVEPCGIAWHSPYVYCRTKEFSGVGNLYEALYIFDLK